MRLLDEQQIGAVRRMKNGCILCANVGTGKSRTALAYYYILCGGTERSLINDEGEWDEVDQKPLPLYVITTARKRDEHDWQLEAIPFLLEIEKVDSWNNIVKYKDVKDAFFIFDEQRATGKGPWAKTFIQIAKHNKWVMLSATPGDNWLDYAPIFIANGFFKNYTHFKREHVRYASGFYKYPKIDSYMNTGRLNAMRRHILVNMDDVRTTEKHDIPVKCGYDADAYRRVMKKRWDIYKDCPVEDPASLCLVLRRIVNSDASRQFQLLEILDDHPKAIIFYNFNYELEILKNLVYLPGTKIAEWNGHKHEPVPDGDRWVYFVQYTAGAEGWNCIKTDTIIFYSQNYSYKIMEQSKGRVDRRNTPFTDLYYYYMKSSAPIDLAINRAVKTKSIFNAEAFIGGLR